MKRIVLSGILLAALSTLGTSLSAQSFDECGFLVDGVECTLFQSDQGGLYIVSTAGFSTGDYIRVTGTFDPSCISFCQQGNGCVFGGATTLCGVLPSPEYIRGDANVDGSYNISDAITLLGAFFTPGASPLLCSDAADANDDGSLNIADAIFVLGGLFSSGDMPPFPFPNCGADPTATDSLDCGEFTLCP